MFGILDSRQSELQLFSLPLPVMIVLSFAPIIMLFLSGGSRNPNAPRGCRKLGMKFGSNLSDQYSEKYDKGVQAGKNLLGRPKWRVKALFIFPVKSCCGVELSKNAVISTGMQYDRQFAFAQEATVDDKDSNASEEVKEWRFITQRAFPKMALVRPEMWVPDTKASTYKPHITYAKSGGCVVVSFPSPGKVDFSWTGIKNLIEKLQARVQSFDWSAEPRTYFRVPFNPTAEQIQQMRLKTQVMKIWKDAPEAIDMSPVIPQDALEKLRTFLGVENKFTMFRVQPQKERLIFKNAPPKEDLGYQAIQGFTDAYPLHFNNLASIHEIVSHLPSHFGKFDAIRFRSNMYITGPEAYDEDSWTKAKFGKATYIVTNRTTRCTLPNVDPDTGTTVRYKTASNSNGSGNDNSLFNEPLKTLKKLRCIDEGAPDQPCMGMQMVPADPEQNEICVGDEVVVLERGKHFKL